MSSFWAPCEGDSLAQGDLLFNCPVPSFPADFPTEPQPEVVAHTPVEVANLIIVTQSCDLANNKAPWAAMCPFLSVDELKAADPKFGHAKEMQNVRAGRYEALYLLPSPVTPEDPWAALVVDFRRIASLPVGFVKRKAAALGPRHRLNSPYLEHFSQAFARFFMRVGLPSAVPSFV
jgi:hypothetical protein